VIATSPLYGVLFDLRYSFFLFDQSVMAVTDFAFSPSLSFGNSDIDLGPGGERWHGNPNQLGSHLSSGWFLRWR
jgi:hypothetical protein